MLSWHFLGLSPHSPLGPLTPGMQVWICGETFNIARRVPCRSLGSMLYSSQGEGPSLSNAYPLPLNFPERLLGELTRHLAACLPCGAAPAGSWPHWGFFPGALSPLPEAPSHPGLDCGGGLPEGHCQGHCLQGRCASVGVEGRTPTRRTTRAPRRVISGPHFQ